MWTAATVTSAAHLCAMQQTQVNVCMVNATAWHMHQVASMLTRRCPFVLKPASRTPIGALIMAEVLAEAPHLPPGAFSILPCSRDGADLFTTDDRFKLLSFTGSPSVSSVLASSWYIRHDSTSAPDL